ncbi:TonB-dependent receptor-like protein [Nonlabens xylanidelens]|uniref:TonB-dependent receptor-like protein n=1 Tax=Nonlabens xylanidelens TaxID=191564 RepID=A0A2S6IF30_9FLAO|nr:TonB-dependent receptor [Nonlabens xylanidelens]PPK92803.1 TonB-dependent receptor-like protein [Nonlabens xylanidelens]PQJ19846.1 collagen-binding protein [Nonlabens xylanidelens]
MKKFILLSVFSVLAFAKAHSQKATLSGTITEEASGETMLNVNVIITDLQTGTITNEYGYYSITLPVGTYNIQFTSIGYATIERRILLEENLKLNISLKEQGEELDAIILTNDVEKLSTKSPQMSVNALSIETIKKIPVVLGETDLIKSLTLLPGVTNAGEGASGFNVRGGAADQNLVLLDEATLYGSDHLFGFFSVFNPDAIKDLKLYKGGIPARYGGRVSSVLDIYQRDGNKNKLSGTGGIGLVASRLLLEGPIIKEKASFLIGGRSSYAHLFLPLFDVDNVAYFYDLNAKASFNLDDSNRLYMSSYFGRDVFNVDNLFSNTFGNSFVNLRWNHLFNDKWFSNASLIYSDYNYGLELDFVEFTFDSGISNLNAKYDLTHFVNDKVKMRYGINTIYYEFDPGKIKPTSSTSGINERQLVKKYAWENGIYADGEFTLSDKININAGLRISNFNRLGQESLNIYENNEALSYNEELEIYESEDAVDTFSSSRSETLESFINLEPRFSIAYSIDDDTSIKASYQRINQYIHLISNTNAPTPFDLYAPSGTFIKPQKGNQVAAGFFKNIGDYSIETEVFYKTVKNRLDYIDGADLIANDAVEQILLEGEARAYGLEFLFRKNEGKLQGWIAYTLSKSEQRTPGRTAVEPGINNGEWYNAAWDKTHDLTITANYDLNKKWDLGANFTLQTGQPVTYPNGQYEFNGLFVPTFESRNSSRLPIIHRLDFSATYTPQPNKKKGWQSSWVFSLYNAYNRRNAVSISFAENEDTDRNEATRLSIFGVVPAVTYNFKF